MADLGFIALLLGLAASIFSAIGFFLGARRGYVRLSASARKGVLVACGLVSLAAYALYYALLSHDFQIEYVASHTSRDMSLIYNLSAFWAGNAGSLLFWAWILSLVAAVVVIRKRGGEEKLLAYASAVVIGTLAFFLVLLIVVANPFEKLPQAPPDGMGLSPMLENPGMILHPPLLLGGYVAFTVPFALAVAALITKSRDGDWLSGARMWALLAWLLLGVGNIVGAWWAYAELGWGGYWAWDPVENAGLMPWLVGTAFLHSITIQRRTGMLKVWTMVLIILAFNLCIFGTFLTRSGFLSSVHTYAVTGLEPLFLAFLAVTLLGPLGLVISRRKYLRSEKREGSLVSKESSFVLTNILFVAATFVIFLGTMLPWISEKIGGTATTVERSFFDKGVGPVFLLIVLLVGLCVFLGWRRTSAQKLIRNGLYPLIMTLIMCLVLYSVGIREWYALTLFPLCSFVIFTNLLSLYREVRARGHASEEHPPKAFFGLIWANRPRYGGMIVHLGIALIAVGIIGSSFYQSEAEVGLQPGESMDIENYTLTYEGMSVNEASTKIVFTAKLSVQNGHSLIGELKPEKYIQRESGHVATEVAIRSMPRWWFPLEDLYVILGGWTDDGTATFKVLVNPLVSWIWIGGGVLALGGMVAFWPRGRQKGSGSEGGRRREKETTKIETKSADGLPLDFPLTSRSDAS